MARLISVLILLLLLSSCSEVLGPEGHTKPVELYEYGLENRSPVAYVLAEKDLTVRRFYYYAVDENQKTVGDTVFAEKAQYFVGFEFPARDIESEMVMFVAELQGDDSVTIKLQTLTEVGRKNEFILSTASTLLTSRVVEFMRQGYPMYTAKNMALLEFLKELNMREEIFDVEDVDFPYGEIDHRCVNCNFSVLCSRPNSVLYAWSFIRQDKNVAEYRDFLDSIKTDFAEDGVINHDGVVMQIADYTLKNQDSIIQDMDSLASSMKLIWNAKFSRNVSNQSVTRFYEGYCGSTKNFVGDWRSQMMTRYYGFGKCNRGNLYEQRDNPFENSLYPDEKFICDISSASTRYWSDVCDTIFAWRPFTQQEKELGLCISDSAMLHTIYAYSDSAKYRCAPDGEWRPVIKYDSLKTMGTECRTSVIYYVEDNDEYRSRAFYRGWSAYTWQKFDVEVGSCNRPYLKPRWTEDKKYFGC